MSSNIITIAASAKVLSAVSQGQSLAQALPHAEQQVDEKQISFLRELCYGSCRWYFKLNALNKMLLSKPLNAEHQVAHNLIIVGLYQLHILQKAEHAVVNNTVEACAALDLPQLKTTVNACLRRFQREQEELLKPLSENPVTEYSHPKWLVKMLQKNWPLYWQDILKQNNQHPPFCLRVNQQHHSRQQYSDLLNAENIEHSFGKISQHSIYLAQATAVNDLPGFAKGWCSVQDEAAQLAAEILNAQSGEKILDLCAAPGGKTCHILESAESIKMTALDLEAKRLVRVEENLQRIGLQAELICADATDNENWWQGEQFDRILLDAPCAAIGVIRRHPDIKLLRQRSDIGQLADIQLKLLHTAWQMLKPGGRLVYATCSIMPTENKDTIEQFQQELKQQEQNATLIKPSTLLVNQINSDAALESELGWQLLPQENGHDGFYYAVIEKNNA